MSGCAGLRLALWRRLVALFAPALAAPPTDRVATGAATLCLLTLALGATQANAQAADTSVDVAIGSSGYALKKTDFGGFASQSLVVYNQPTHGRLFDTTLREDVRVRAAGFQFSDLSVYFAISFADGAGPVEYRPPATAISVVNGYDSFIFELHDSNGDTTTATMTIDLVGASTQMAAGGAPTVTAAMGTTAYNTGVPLTASITGVTDPNGIDVATLKWQWKQADVTGIGANAISAYSDIAGATATGVTSSGFTPLAAQAGKYLRVCASFMDQFSTPASAVRCSTGVLVTNVPFFGDASVDNQVWVTGTAITDLILPAATGGNGAVTYSLTPSLPAGLSFTAATRTISGAPAATVAKTTYTYAATDTDGDTNTLTFRIEAAVNAVPAFAANAAIAEQTWLTGTAITALTLPAATGGNGTLTYALTPALPAGLSLDAATRTISGTPTAAPQSNYTWTVADADNNTADTDAASLTFSVISNLRLRLRLFLEGPLR